MSQIVAFSGGKDSTALVLRLAELDEKFQMIFTPTGDEPEDCLKHIENIVKQTERELIMLSNGTLDFWINEFDALPNWRQRWCTRLLKIVPCIAYLKAHPGSVLLVGLRADEEEREGLYGDFASYRYPLREWEWGINEVWDYLNARSITIPPRTDCELCWAQRLIEWYRLYRDKPDKFQVGIDYEIATGRTFRSRARDSQPAALIQLRSRFEAGYVPKEKGKRQECRVCSL